MTNPMAIFFLSNKRRILGVCEAARIYNADANRPFTDDEMIGLLSRGIKAMEDDPSLKTHAVLFFEFSRGTRGGIQIDIRAGIAEIVRGANLRA